MTARFLLALATVAVGLSLTACGPQTVRREPCPAGARCLEYGNGSDPQTLDPQPATTTNEAAILRELEGLYTDGPKGELQPGVATTAEVSPDGLTWTLFDGVNLNLVNPDITGWVDNDADIHPIRLLCRDDAGQRPAK